MKSRLETAGDLRTFLANIATAAFRGEVQRQDAAIAVKACEQINASIYSEAKIWALIQATGGNVGTLGSLPIGSTDALRVAIENRTAA